MSGDNDIRSSFLGYFAKAGHEVLPSSPLVPRNDPTLMFTNAGRSPRRCRRAATSEAGA
jgi:alanyl-tRNA synthetase